MLHWEERYASQGRRTSEGLPNFYGREGLFSGEGIQEELLICMGALCQITRRFPDIRNLYVATRGKGGITTGARSKAGYRRMDTPIRAALTCCFAAMFSTATVIVSSYCGLQLHVRIRY